MDAMSARFSTVPEAPTDGFIRPAAARDIASDGLATELATMKDERDVIRARVTDMLQQLDALSL